MLENGRLARLASMWSLFVTELSQARDKYGMSLGLGPAYPCHRRADDTLEWAFPMRPLPQYPIHIIHIHGVLLRIDRPASKGDFLGVQMASCARVVRTPGDRTRDCIFTISAFLTCMPVQPKAHTSVNLMRGGGIGPESPINSRAENLGVLYRHSVRGCVKTSWRIIASLESQSIARPSLFTSTFLSCMGPLTV